MVVRGEIWWADLGTPRGSGPGYRRPVIVVQSDKFNQSGIRTVMVAVITSNLRLALAPGNIPLSAQQSGLPKESVVNVSQMMTLDKNYLLERVGTLPADLLPILDEGLRLALAL